MRGIIFTFFLMGCVGTVSNAPEMNILSIIGGDYDIAYWTHDTDDVNPIHIYIEGDGHAFDASGHPTDDPTPRGTFMRDLAARDTSPNVVYMARPCQFIMSSKCNVHDWTDGRFSEKIVNEMSDAVRWVARGRPIVLIGYSGGAMISGLIINNNPDLDIRKWITIAGVLNHTDWTEYFGDTPLSRSQNLNGLPHVFARHYVASDDVVVPFALSQRWVGSESLTSVPGATHDIFPDLQLDFNY